MAESYPVKVKNVYRGPLSGRVSPQIAPEEYNSMKFEPPTVGSYGHADTTQVFTPSGVVTVTANNRFEAKDFPRNGYFSQIDDCPGFGHWIKTGTEPQAIDLIPRMQDFGYVSGVTPLGLLLPNRTDTQVNLRTTPRIMEAVNPNRLGINASKEGNLYSSLRNLMFDDVNRLDYESAEWIDFLSQKGFSIDTTEYPGVLGLGVRKGNFLAAYHTKKGFLIAEDNFHERAEKLISSYGLSNFEATQAMKRAVLLHEIAHVLGIPGGREAEEMQGLFQAEFYSKLAENFKGKRMERIYRALAQENMDHARSYSRARFRKRSDKTLAAIIASMEAKFVTEGIVLGKSGKELENYVKERIDDTYGVYFEDESSYEPETKTKSSKSAGNKSPSGGESLDEIVDKEAFSIIRGRSKEVSYEGHEVYGDGDFAELRVKDGKESEESGAYKGRVSKGDYKSMKDVKEREAKEEQAEAKEASAEASN